MYKLLTLTALLGLSLSIQCPTFAADAKASAPASTTDSKVDSSATSDAKDATATAKPGHEHMSSKKAVMELTSLTDKQKQSIEAVYSDNKPQYEALQKQLRELRESEWTKVKPLLTDDQIKELHQNAHKAHEKKRSEQ